MDVSWEWCAYLSSLMLFTVNDSRHSWNNGVFFYFCWEWEIEKNLGSSWDSNPRRSEYQSDALTIKPPGPTARTITTTKTAMMTMGTTTAVELAPICMSLRLIVLALSCWWFIFCIHSYHCNQLVWAARIQTTADLKQLIHKALSSNRFKN